jgi:predicted MFS family arabinose efflux permease
MLARLDLSATFAMSVVLFTSSTAMMWGMRAMPPTGDRRRVEWATIRQGFDYVLRRPILRSNFVIDLNAMVFGMPTALFPAFGIEVLGGDATTVGMLYAAPGIGALLAALFSGWIGRIRRQGRAVVMVVISWGAALTAFGLSRSLLLAVLMLTLAGASDVLSAIFRVTILQLAVPDEMRGRLFGINVAVVAGGPRLGDLRAGALADLTSVPFSIVSGGLACIVGALVIARRNPAYAQHEWQNQVPEREDG